MRAAEILVQLERALIVPDRLLRLAGLGKRDRHVEQDARIGGVVPEGQTVGREGGLVVPLPFQGEPLIQIVEALRPQRLAALLAEQALPETHELGGVSDQSRTGTMPWLRAKIP